ncbi:hypothetical protein PIB30_058891 [Stylosanthes scabra]|uniref:Uncharacterized protein n=1 Tax=Stylosanthes scabra TaxID=79078 RepID=A0ABU6YHH9_9FABA|nr:hypothetical protein [Stylosanthes scabra]
MEVGGDDGCCCSWYCRCRQERKAPLLLVDVAAAATSGVGLSYCGRERKEWWLHKRTVVEGDVGVVVGGVSGSHRRRAPAPAPAELPQVRMTRVESEHAQVQAMSSPVRDSAHVLRCPVSSLSAASPASLTSTALRHVLNATCRSDNLRILDHHLIHPLPIPSLGPGAHQHSPPQLPVVWNIWNLFPARNHHLKKSAEGSGLSVCVTSNVWANLVSHKSCQVWYLSGTTYPSPGRLSHAGNRC